MANGRRVCNAPDCDATDVKHLELIRVLTNVECVEIELTTCKIHFLGVMDILYDNIQTNEKDEQ